VQEIEKEEIWSCMSGHRFGWGLGMA